MPTSLSPHPEVTILPSLPPSPSFLDEVFSYPRPWSFRLDDFGLQELKRSSSGSAGNHVKGKEKQAIGDEDEEGDGDAQQRTSSHEAYPPMTDEAAETRRVEETLKRWELAERQRRRSARESAQYTSGPSLLSSVTRTATLVLSGRTSLGTSAGQGSTREGYAVPLDDIDQTRSSRDIAVYSPSPSLQGRNTSLDAAATALGAVTPENPFVHPSECARTPSPSPSPSLTPVTPTPVPRPSTPPSPSPFGDPYAQGDLTARVSNESKMHARTRSSASRRSVVPPPRPLGLPCPPEDVPRAAQPQPTPRPFLRSLPRREVPEERQQVRWWHDWLCGCGEGPDRGGDNQAGRTNPFE